MQVGRVFHVVRPQRRDDHVVKESAVGIHHRQQVSDRKTAAFPLLAWLPEVRPQLRRIGHREARAIDEQEPVAVPQCCGRRRFESLRKRVHQTLDQFERQPLSRLAVGRRAEPLARQMRQMGHGRVLVHHLQDEQMERRIGVQLTLAPRVLQIATDPLHLLALQEPRQVFPDLPQGG